MPWNYRVLRHPDGCLLLHEVYYDKNGNPDGYAADPATFGVMESEEGIFKLKDMLTRALEAVKKPILNIKDLEGLV